MALVEMFKYWGYDSLETGTLPDGTPIYDRAIDSADVALFNELLYTSGIDKNYEDCFKIVPGNGLSIIRKPGYASLGGRPALDPNPQTVTLAAGNTYYYVMESNAEIEYRMAREGVLLAAETSIPPQRDQNHYQIILALIAVPPGATQITEAMITDLRFDSDYCGIITINANYSFEELLITADDIQDTDTKFIPIKTGDGSVVLHNDGSYKSVTADNIQDTDTKFIPIKTGDGSAVLHGDEVFKKVSANALDTLDYLRIGDYRFVKSGVNVDIKCDNEATSDRLEPTTYNVLAGASYATDLENSLAPSSHANYATITFPATYGTYDFQIVYSYTQIVLIGSASNINISVKIKGRRSKEGDYAGVDQRRIALYNLATNSIIPNTDRDLGLFGTTASIKTINYSFGNLSEIGTDQIGVMLKYHERNNVTSLRNYIYGSDITVTQTLSGASIGNLTPGGIITSPGGTVQTMMTQGILDNTQDILLLKGGIEL